jgi:flagellar hook protein FlgE
MSSFSVPLSGLVADSSWLNTISDNLANLNTDGYKDETLSFGDIFNQMQGASGNGDPIQIGSGVEVNATTSNFSDGTVESTGVNSNMALQGNGMFIVQGNGETSYTRDGDFSVNSSGQLVTAGGQLVLGYPAVDGVVDSNGTLGPIDVSPTGTIAGTPTSSFQLNTNLNSGSTVGQTFSTPITVYDSLGAPQTLNVEFTNTGANAWSYNITLPASATGGTGTTPTTLSTGTMTFNSSGNLLTPAGSSVTGIKITGLADGAANMNLTWDLTAAGSPAITQLDSTSATSATTQNGFGVGTLTGYSVGSDGTVAGQYSNNQTEALGQVAVASFANDQGLSQSSNGNYQATTASGAAVVGRAGAGGNGTIEGGSVEESNVDLSTEFANMIVAQQCYQANAKSLTTMDQVDQATLQMIT